MPTKAKRPCSQPGCPDTAATNGRCVLHSRETARAKDRQRNRGPRVYDRKVWKEARLRKLAETPFCEIRTHCEGALANEVDHVDGDQWNLSEDNLRSACKPCHSARTARDQAFGRKAAVV